MKISLKLNQYHYIISSLVLLLFFVALSAQYYFIKKNIIQVYYDKTYKESLHIRDNYRSAFDRIQYNFKLNEKENLKKVNFAARYINENKNYSLDVLEKILNKDVYIGKYEVFIINKDYIIEDSSYKTDIGLNLGTYKVNKILIDSVFNKTKKYDISPSKIDSASMNLKRYIMKLSLDETKIIEVSYVLNSYKIIENLYNKHNKEVDNLDIYVLTKNMIQKLDFKSSKFKKLNFDEHWRKSLDFLRELNFILPKYKDQINNILYKDINKEKIRLNTELDKIFLDENILLSNVDAKNRKSYHYSISNSLFDDHNETKLIIKTGFSNNILKEDINKSFYTFILIFLSLFIILWFLYRFVLDNVSLKLSKIINHIQDNKISLEKNIIVKEIDTLQKNYNKLHTSLNKEAEKNQLLLSQNKEFIADMVHQIRTPLTVIMANSSRIEMLGHNDVQEFVKQINSSISMLSNSYEDLSYIISNDTIEYKAINLNLSKYVNDRIEFFKDIIEANNKTLEFNIQDEINIFMNDIELERLIDNNISNAIKHSKKNAKIFIKLEKNTDKNISLYFQSEGKDIKNPDLLFNKNYRENDSKRSLGLGLHMVKTICDKNSIEYKVKSHLNKNIFIYNFKNNSNTI